MCRRFHPSRALNKRIFSTLAALALTLSLSLTALADTIRLKDGSVIRGQVIAFNNQQFTVLVGAGSRGRRSQITLYMEDVESIEFDSAGSAPATTAANNNNDDLNNRPIQPATTTRPPVQQRPTTPQNTQPDVDDTASNGSQPVSRPASQTSTPFFQINTKVRGDNAANGWTNSGLVVRRGQRIRLTASGSVSLGRGRASTPAGVPAIPDNEKLMRSYPTGALIAVIGDDNDDFIFVGGRREFIAQRDGVLFLGVNEGNLSDNTGAYDVIIEAEAMSSTR
jgi:small nuclear ribonucleoprotein (snRNP)-like protein